MTDVHVGGNESFESALRRFTRKVQQEGILVQARRNEYFEKPSIKRKRKEAAKRRKSARSTGRNFGRSTGPARRS